LVIWIDVPGISERRVDERCKARGHELRRPKAVDEIDRKCTRRAREVGSIPAGDVAAIRPANGITEIDVERPLAKVRFFSYPAP
jgi:hypothetical protein